MNGIAAIWGCV